MSLKPFYIKYTPDVTDAQIAEVFNKAVAAGARLTEGLRGFHDEDAGSCFAAGEYMHFGITVRNNTFFANKAHIFGKDAVEIRLDQVDEWLGIAAKQPTVAERMAALIEEYRDRIPDWAQCAAVNRDGVLIFCSEKLHLEDDWIVPYGADSHALLGARNLDLIPHWRETLTELPTVKRELIVEDYCDPVAHATAVYDQQKMIYRDERDQSQAELDYSVKRDAQGYIEFCNKTKTLAIPSICLAEPTSHMRMLGGEFGGKHDSR